MVATFTTGNNATVKRWTDKFFKEAFYENPLKNFMGTSDRAPIQIIPELEKVAGDRARVHMTPRLDPDSGISGDGQISGNEIDVSIFTDDLTITQLKQALAVREFDMSQQRVNLKLKDHIYDNLKAWETERLRNDIMVALTDTSEGRVQARYLYGALDANWNATHATALLNVDSTNDRLTLDMIEVAVRKAKYSGTYKMNPAMVNTVDGFPSEGFIFLGHHLAIRDLRKDPNFKNQVQQFDYLKAKQGVFDGAFYVGTYAGVHIYEMPDPQGKLLVGGAGAGSINVAHNLLLGAQACMIGYSMRPEFRLKAEDDYGTNAGVALVQIRGQKKIVFNSEDWGVVHVFSAATADA